MKIGARKSCIDESDRTLKVCKNKFLTTSAILGSKIFAFTPWTLGRDSVTRKLRLFINVYSFKRKPFAIIHCKANNMCVYKTGRTFVLGTFFRKPLLILDSPSPALCSPCPRT